MNHARTLTLGIVAAGLMALITAGAASATVLNGAEGMLSPGTPGTAVSEGKIVLDASIKIECEESTVTGTTTNTGGSSETIVGKLESLAFKKCGSLTITNLKLGTQELHTAETKSNNNGTLTATGTETTVEYFGLHCIFGTNNTDLGIVTGSATTGSNVTLDISARIPRVGGRSGAFCGGETVEMTGSYKVTSPSTMNVE